MPYTRFWHDYARQHPPSAHQTMINPAALFGACLCLFLLACWAAHQTQSRCAECNSWPVRCHCPGDRVSERR